MDFSVSTVTQITKWLQSQDVIAEQILQHLRKDHRHGVRRALEQYQRRIAAQVAEKARVAELYRYEILQREKGFQYIAGVDEAGRGPLAGPVVAAAVMFPSDIFIPLINDSKKLQSQQREMLFTIICSNALSYGIGIVDNDQIDKVNILQATYQAMSQAVGQLQPIPDVLLNDAVQNPYLNHLPQVPIIRGDAVSISIAAASILAKVTRDRLMDQYDQQYPQYGFARHKGYPTPEHYQALKKFGPCPIHRRSFAPVLQAEEDYCAG